MRYHIRQCRNDLCRFRFPAPVDEAAGQVCPQCHDVTSVVAEPSAADFTRPRPSAALPHIEILLDNTRSVYNVGSMFRTADGAGVNHMHLCGITATPDHPRFAKTALGGETEIRWTHYLNGVDAATALKRRGFALWALEDTATAVSLFDVRRADIPERLVLVLGNEVTGVDPGILALCDRVVYIPMVGTKKSLNVTIAQGTAVYYLLYAA